MTTTNGATTEHVQPAAIVRAAPQSGGLEPANFGELKALAAHAAQSQFFGAKNESQALMLMMAGRDLGLSYTQALRVFHVIEGKPTLSADGMVAVCIQSGACEYFRVDGDDTAATATTRRRGQPEQSCTFSLDDAKRAGLLGKGNWSKYPGRMLKARAKANLARDVYPELLAGLCDPDEMSTERSAPAAVEVVVEARQERDPAAREAFADAIEQAKDGRSLKAVAASIKVAHTRGLLGDDDRLALSAAFEAKKAALKAPPATPPSAPDATIPAPKSDADTAAAIDRGEDPNAY